MTPAAHTTTLPAHCLRWNLAAIYPGLASDAYAADLRNAHGELRVLGALLGAEANWPPPPPAEGGGTLPCAELQAFSRRCDRARELLADLHVYCTALLSVGEECEAAQQALRRLSALAGWLQVHEQRVGSALARWPAVAFERLCTSGADEPETAAHWRLLRDRALQPAADPTVMLLAPEASRAWSALYERLARNLVVRLPDAAGAIEELGLARAMAVLTGTDAAARERAWHAIRAAWRPHETTVAAILNSLAGHRLKVHRLAKGAGDVRAVSLEENRIRPETLDALMAAVQARRGELRVALEQMASILGKPVLDPWDLAAGYAVPDAQATGLSAQEGLAEVRAAFAEVAPEMGEFVDLMARNGWIDARPGDGRRRLGAFQTSLRRGRHPIVFANCEGRWSDLVVLAHELGHAFHYWVLRDRPAHQHHLPIALAECASSFAEMQLRRRRARSGEGPGGHAGAWDEAQAAVAFLLNIGASYTFELELYQQRRQHELGAGELSERLAQAWQHWFGSGISTCDDRGWVRKAHFSGPRPFNNYPYMIGYLMAVCLEDERRRRGPGFFALFERMLCDSATESLEGIVLRVFGQDAGSQRFWNRSLDLVLARLAGVGGCACD